MLYTISIPPTDDHTFPMFQELIKSVTLDFEAYYIWSCPPSKVLHFLDHIKFSKPVVILGIKDLLDGWQEFNYWQDRQQLITQKINNVVRQNPQITFILFTSLENLNLEISEPNLTVIPWGGDIVNQKQRYRSLEPVLNKNFDSTSSFISLNRNSRDHRIVAISYLFGKKLQNHGYITYLANKMPNRKPEPRELLDRICWQFDMDRHSRVRDTIITGYKLFLDFPLNNNDDFEIYQHYGKSQNDNAANFDVRLRAKYQNSFVEIVSESSFCSPSFNITEKTANCFFGCNFPILLGGSGLVQHLRDLEIDVFDDVIDHSYDKLSNPFDRIITAIDCNEHMLKDAKYSQQQWRQCQNRFESNINKIKNIYDWYDARTRRMFNEVIQKIC